jgi:competence protein ComFC
VKLLPKIYENLLEFIWPRFCINCSEKLKTGQGIFCEDCINRINYIHMPYCDICGDPVDGDVRKNYTCQYCNQRNPHFLMARSAIRFDGVAKKTIYELKYNKETYVGKYLAQLAFHTIENEYENVIFDYVTYIPLHKRKTKQRTFNQSKLIAQYIAKMLKVNLAADLLIRSKYTNTQTLLNFQERRKNISGAFKAANISKLENKTILLVDDVMTTGATVNECSKVLKTAGALNVYVITVARG